MDSVTAAFIYSLFGWRSLGQACQESLIWAKLLQQNWSFFLSLSFLLFPTYIGSGGLCGRNLLSLQFANTPIKFVRTGHEHLYNSYRRGWGCGLELAAPCSLAGKASACYLGRELIAARSSFAPRPVPENRCVTCHILNRWTCHMPLKAIVQISLTL